MTAAAAGPVPDDVADRDRDAVVVDRDEVVPVAARLGVGAAREVARRRRPAGRAGELARQQAALQHLGHLVLDGVQPGPVQRLRALARHRADDRALAGAHARRGRGERQPDRADRPARPTATARRRRTAARPRPPTCRATAAARWRMALTNGWSSRQPHAAGRAREHLDLVARALHDDGLGRAERQRVPGDHGGDLRGRGGARERRHDVREPLRGAPRDATRPRAGPRAGGRARTGRRARARPRGRRRAARPGGARRRRRPAGRGPPAAATRAAAGSRARPARSPGTRGGPRRGSRCSAARRRGRCR